MAEDISEVLERLNTAVASWPDLEDDVVLFGGVKRGLKMGDLRALLNHITPQGGGLNTSRDHEDV